MILTFMAIFKGALDFLRNRGSIESSGSVTSAVVDSKGADIFKAYIPNHLYKPPFGMPRRDNTPQMKKLAVNPYVFSVIKTLCDEATSIDWEIKVKEEFQIDQILDTSKETEKDENADTKVEKDYSEKIKEITKFFQNPNGNEESFNHILRQLITDISEVDAGVLVKVFNVDGEFKQIFARDGCFDYNTKIETDDGFISIGKIVKDKLNVKVKSYNKETGEIEWKQVINWFNNGPTTEWYRIKSLTDSKFRSMTVTGNHKIWTQEGYKLVKDLSLDDKLYTKREVLSDDEFQLILGGILGDGSLSNRGYNERNFYTETHSEKQKDYLLYKKESLKRFNPTYSESRGRYDESHPFTKKCTFKTKSNIVFNEFSNITKKELFDKLEVRGLAIWIQDDGYRYSNGAIDIGSHSFSKESQEYALKILKDKFGLIGKLCLDKRCNKYFIRLNKENGLLMSELIKDYIHPSMNYKVGDLVVGSKININEGKVSELYEVDIDSIEQYTKYDTKYDIEVEDNHNYFAQGRLVSNSLFLKNPDIYGYIGNRRDFVSPLPDGFTGVGVDVGGTPTPGQQQLMKQYSLLYKEDAAYFQYGWTAGSMPVPFGKREIVYMMSNPRGDSIYGRSPVAVLMNTIMNLIYGIDFNLDFYTNNNMPDGVIQLLGADAGQIKQFRENMENQTKFTDDLGKKRKIFNKAPISSTEVKFTPFQWNSKDMEVMAQQEWFTKILWMCYSDDTEILTDNGWKLFKDLREEKVARVNPKTMNLDFVEPEDKQCYNYDEEMIRFVNRNIDLKVTPEHKMLYQTRDKFERGIPFEIAKAGDLIDKHSCIVIPQAVNYIGTKLENKKFGDIEFTGEQFSKFMGFWLGDGWANSSDNRVEFAVSKVCYPETYKKITDLFKEVGIEWKENEYISQLSDKPMLTLRYSNKELNHYLTKFGKAKTKYIPKDVLNSTENEMLSFLEYYEMADGCSEKYGKNKRFFSMSKELINGCQEMYIKLGIASNINEWNGGYELSVRKSKTDKRKKKDFCYVYKNSIIKEKYNGKVYDVTVADHHFLVVRRNGRAVVSSNCFGVNADEMGFLKDSNKTNGESQVSTFKRKAIGPLLKVIQYHLNTQIIPEFFSKGNEGEMIDFADCPVQFEFDTYDSDEDMKELSILKMEKDLGIKTEMMIAKERGINLEELSQEREKQKEEEQEVFDAQNPIVEEKPNLPTKPKEKKVEEKSSPLSEMNKYIDGVEESIVKTLEETHDEEL